MALAWPLDTMHTTSTLILILAVFGASSVEMVEALTIVVAAGVSRGWRSALEGAATAVVVLALLVGFIGVPLIHYVPIDTLRVVVGVLLLVLGLAWLRKAILRASGHKAPHDEDRIYAETVAELSGDGSGGAGGAGGAGGEDAGKTRDGVAFAVAFKGVFLEGTEVVLIVVSLGASQGRLGLAALSAGAAAVVVAGVGVLVARQLSEVPENTIKTVVGVMLTSFGVFWVGEGAGAMARQRPGHSRAGWFLRPGDAGRQPPGCGASFRCSRRCPPRCPRRDRAAPLPAGLRGLLVGFPHWRQPGIRPGHRRDHRPGLPSGRGTTGRHHRAAPRSRPPSCWQAPIAAASGRPDRRLWPWVWASTRLYYRCCSQAALATAAYLS